MQQLSERYVPASMPQKHLSSELQLLTACARSVVDEHARTAMSYALQQEPNWSVVHTLAVQHKVVPLLARSLQQIDASLVPESVVIALRDSAAASAQRTLFLTGELLRVLELLEAACIPAVTLKGPGLAAVAYGNIGLRQFDDLDVLVRRRDLLLAKQKLAAHGYCSLLSLTQRQEAAYVRSQYVYPLIHHEQGVVVELHQDVRPRYFAFRPERDALWNGLSSMHLGGKEIRAFSLEELLIILCVHGTNHCWERLAWICDIAELLRAQPAINWQGLLLRARELGAERMVLLGLALAHNVLDTSLPKPIDECIAADPSVSDLATQVIIWLDRPVDQPLTNAMRVRFHLRAREQLRHRVLYCLQLVVSPTEEDWTLRPLPAAVASCYALLRPLWLLWRYGQRPLKGLLGR